MTAAEAAAAAAAAVTGAVAQGSSDDTFSALGGEPGSGLFGNIFGFLTDTATGLLQDCESNCTLSFIGQPEARLRCLEFCSRPQIIQAPARAGIQTQDILIYGGLAVGAYLLFRN